MGTEIDELVRSRLRALRTDQGWSLDELAERTGVGASTISRIETGNRSISLDVLIPLARELGVAVDDLVGTADQDDIVIRATPVDWDGMKVWSLSRPSSQTAAFKIRLEPTSRAPDSRVHPGHDWMFVLSGKVRLTLGERVIIVREGESAEFSTMTPHAVSAEGGPAELIMLFDRSGAHAHFSVT